MYVEWSLAYSWTSKWMWQILGWPNVDLFSTCIVFRNSKSFCWLFSFFFLFFFFEWVSPPCMFHKSTTSLVSTLLVTPCGLFVCVTRPSMKNWRASSVALLNWFLRIWYVHCSFTGFTSSNKSVVALYEFNLFRLYVHVGVECTFAFMQYLCKTALCEWYWSNRIMQSHWKQDNFNLYCTVAKIKMCFVLRLSNNADVIIVLHAS